MSRRTMNAVFSWLSSPHKLHTSNSQKLLAHLKKMMRTPAKDFRRYGHLARFSSWKEIHTNFTGLYIHLAVFGTNARSPQEGSLCEVCEERVLVWQTGFSILRKLCRCCGWPFPLFGGLEVFLQISCMCGEANASVLHALCDFIFAEQFCIKEKLCGDPANMVWFSSFTSFFHHIL